MLSIPPLISKSSSPCINYMGIFPRAPITIGITLTFMLHDITYLRDADKTKPEWCDMNNWPNLIAVSGSIRRHQFRRMQDSQIKSQVNHVLWCEGHCPQSVLVKEPEINQQVYKEILRRRLPSVCEKRQDPSQNNAPAHNTLSFWPFLAKKNIGVLEQPLYSPELSLCVFFFQCVYNPKCRKCRLP